MYLLLTGDTGFLTSFLFHFAYNVISFAKTVSNKYFLVSLPSSYQPANVYPSFTGGIGSINFSL